MLLYEQKGQRVYYTGTIVDRHHKMEYIRQIFDGLLTKKKQILEQNKLEEVLRSVVDPQ